MHAMLASKSGMSIFKPRSLGVPVMSQVPKIPRLHKVAGCRARRIKQLWGRPMGGGHVFSQVWSWWRAAEKVLSQLLLHVSYVCVPRRMGIELCRSWAPRIESHRTRIESGSVHACVQREWTCQIRCRIRR